MVLGSDGHNRSQRARAQATTASAAPAAALAAGRLAQGQAAQAARGLDADAGEAHDPSAEGVRPRRRGETPGVGQESQDAPDGATAKAGLSKEAARPPPPIDRGQDGHGLRLARTLTLARVGFLEGRRGLVARSLDSRQLRAQGTILVAARVGVALPRRATLVDLRPLTPGAGLPLAPWQVATGEVVG